MRFRFLFLLASAGLLASCDTEQAPVRLDFVGTAGLTSSNRTAGAGDTLSTRTYASSESGEPLTRLRVTVNYEPTANPIVYPVPASGYDPSNTPNDPQLVYLDSVLPAGTKSLLLQTRFSARTTSGTERWEYSVSNAEGRSAGRAYRLTVRKADSLAVVHAYTLLARPADTGPAGRRFLALRPGLLLPKFAVNTQPDNQQLVDLIFVASPADIRLQAPSFAGLALPAARWLPAHRRATRLRRTTLDQAAFNGTTTAAALQAAYDGGQAEAADSGPLEKGNVLAFRTADERYGLLYMAELARTPVTLVSCAVRIQK